MPKKLKEDSMIIAFAVENVSAINTGAKVLGNIYL